MTLDEAIEYFRLLSKEDAEKAEELQAKQFINFCEVHRHKKNSTDHLQLVGWLRELKELREENINFKNEIERLRDSVDSFIRNGELDFAELKEAKRLLKAAVEDIHELLCDRKNLDGIGQSCNVCSDIDNCLCWNRCDIIPELRTWRYADEALALIGEDGENDA